MVSSASAVNRQIGRRVAEFRGWVARKLRVMHPGCPGCSPQSGSLSCARNRGRAGWPGAMALAGVTQTTPGNRGRLVSCLQQLSQIGQRDLETDSAGSNGWQYRKCMRYNGLQRGSRKTEGPRCGGHSLNGRTAPATLDERSGSCRATSRRMGVSVPPRGTVARNAIKRGVTHESGATKPSVQVGIQVGLAHRKRQPGQQAVADAEVAGEGRTHRRSAMGVVQPAVETRREVTPTEQRRGSRQRACSEAKAKGCGSFSSAVQRGPEGAASGMARAT